MDVDSQSAARGFVFGDGTVRENRAAAYFCGLKDEALLPFFEVFRSPRTYGKVNENLEYVRDLGQAIGVGTFGIRKRMRKGFGAFESPLYLLGFMRRDLCSSFFLLPSHRSRFESGLTAAERRFWNTVSVKDTGITAEVHGTAATDTPSITLEDNILTGRLVSVDRATTGAGACGMSWRWRYRRNSVSACARA